MIETQNQKNIENEEYKDRVVTVDAVVVREGHVLLIKRKAEPYAGYWALPGGYMEYDETGEQAALRELAEETGLEAEHAEFLGVFDAPDRHPEQRVSLSYFVLDWRGEPEAGDDAAEFGWFALDELPELAFDHLRIIDRYKESRYGDTQ